MAKLNCSRHQVKLFNEKRSDLEEQQLHLNVGLQKIRETVDQVGSVVWRLLNSHHQGPNKLAVV